jgi:hypothetical protein
MHHVNVVGHRPLVAPFGASQARYATNPYTIGLPATAQFPMTILDMATSVVALGKVRVARNKGERMARVFCSMPTAIRPPTPTSCIATIPAPHCRSAATRAAGWH